MAKVEEVELEGLDDLELDDDDLLADDSDDNNEEEEVEDAPEPEPQEKPKRGRPKGSGKKPAAKDDKKPEPEEKPRRRGRPKGSKNSPKVATVALTGTQVDPTSPVFLFKTALDNHIKDVKKAGGSTEQLEWAKNLADLLFS